MYLAYLFTFLAASQSLILAHGFQKEDFGAEKQIPTSNGQSITMAVALSTKTIVTTFETIVTSRNTEITAQDYESTITFQEAKNFNFRDPMWWKSPIFHQALATAKPIEKSFSILQAQNRRNFINLGPLPTFIPRVTTPSPPSPPLSSAISTSSLTITFPDLTTAFAVTTISSN
ncbi:uncharacterized protein EAF01_000525 [Botrytis porri]|uniref:Uncharacterized protein n=1 Tax=Botrytis porri TaxID=87229 RepID=A0A4Z1L152_9HELO|nr:uncharacterized protein EAF01_000525 [Botrytis porri]KAF7914119.1 hypothetical protein EAF01_000525 [Botrytis porri]TGO90494.1 hypothetical protein BPOR_0062g00140 [Botrytis porri]